MVALDDDSLVNVNYGSGYIPTLYVIDQNQTVAYSEIGFNFEDVINTLNDLSVEPIRPIPNGSSDTISFLIPLIFIIGMVIFTLVVVVYGRLQQKKQAEVYQTHYPPKQKKIYQRPLTKKKFFLKFVQIVTIHNV